MTVPKLSGAVGSPVEPRFLRDYEITYTVITLGKVRHCAGEISVLQMFYLVYVFQATQSRIATKAVNLLTSI